ncbi:MAG: PAS domain S-box protein [Bacteroidales bacterium]|nr:PAS domain S-box protein [Bacteroidales bacterium]
MGNNFSGRLRSLIHKLEKSKNVDMDVLMELKRLSIENQWTDDQDEKDNGDHLLRLSAAFEQSANSIMITDTNGVIEYVNTRFCQVTGFTPEEAIGKTPRIIKHEKSQINYKELWDTITSGKTWTGEFLNRTKTGELFWELATISPIRNSKGKITNYLAIKENITIRKETEKQLEDAEEFYLTMLADFPVMVWHCDPEGIFKFFNKTFLNFIGEPLAGTGEINYETLIYPDDKKKFFDALSLGLSRKSSFITEYRIKDQFGNFRWVLNHARDFYDHEGNYIGLLGTCTDIHDRILAETRLMESENKYRRMFEEAAMGIFRLDRKFRFIEGNKALALILGYDDHTRFVLDASNNPQQFFPDVRTQKRIIKEIIRSKDNHFVVEKQLINKQKEKIYVVIHLSKIDDHEKEGFYLEGFIENITQRKEAEKQIKKARDDAEKARMAQSEFLSLMSHEIRTPLNAVFSLTDLMLDDDLNTDQQENLNTIKISASHLLGLIDDLLDFNKIETGNLIFEKTDFEIRSLVGDLFKALELKAKEKNIQLFSHIDNDVPPVLQSDTLRLRQILFNMLSNAIKFTEKGFVSLKVKKKPDTIATENRIYFEIEDTGIGIASDRLDAIFEKFTQAETSTSRKYGGSGLGLTICKRLVELQHGEISAKSKPGQGSVFSFWLPMETGEKKFPTPQAVQGKPSHKTLKGFKILLVEDDKMNQFVGRKVLENKWKANLTIVSTGEEALDVIRKESFDLVLMDLLLPGISGFEVTHKIRQNDGGDIRDPMIPVIAFTADAFAETRAKAYEAGVDDFVSKPFDYFKLFEKISRYKT